MELTIQPWFAPPAPSPPASRKNHRPSLLSGLCWAQCRTVASGYLERIQTPTSCFYATVGFPSLALAIHPRSYENHVYFWKLSEESCPWWQHRVMKAASPVWAGLVQVRPGLFLRDLLWNPALLTTIHPKGQRHSREAALPEEFARPASPLHYF